MTNYSSNEIEQIQGVPTLQKGKAKEKTTYPLVLDSKARLLFLKNCDIQKLEKLSKKLANLD
jgi:hypothetical protein